MLPGNKVLSVTADKGISQNSAVAQVVSSATVLTYAWPASIRAIHVDTETNDSAMAITLPSVAEAAGNVYLLNAHAISGAATLDDAGDDPLMTQFTLADNDAVICISDGRRWYIAKAVDAT